jgi:hypothetical protein
MKALPHHDNFQHLDGKLPVEKDNLKICKSGDFNLLAQSFKKLCVKNCSDEKNQGLKNETKRKETEKNQGPRNETKQMKIFEKRNEIF